MTSDEFPEDSAKMIQCVHVALAQLKGMGLIATPSLVLIPSMSALRLGTAIPQATADTTEHSAGAQKPQVTQIANVAEEAINEALGLSVNTTVAGPDSVTVVLFPTKITDYSKKIGGSDSPTVSILVYNMYDKDEETEDNWEEDIKEEFEEECSKFGELCNIVVEYKEMCKII